MSHCVVTIEISHFYPQNFDFKDFSFTFRSEIKNFESTITVNIKKLS